MKTRFKYLPAFALLLASVSYAPLASAAPTFVIDTLSGWNGVDAIASFGEPNTATYGQTVTVGPDNVLNGFTFLLDQTSLAPVHFRAYVMAWDDAQSRATGPVLYTSGNMQTTNVVGFETFNINTGNLALNSGSDYVLFFNASSNFDGLGDSANWASRASSNVYPSGLFVFQNNGGNFGNLSTQPWDRDWQGPGYDLAFRAEFSRVPEPASLLLGCLGAMGGGFAMRRRRRSQ
jgi:hypothetical protein